MQLLNMLKNACGESGKEEYYGGCSLLSSALRVDGLLGASLFSCLPR